MLVRDTKWDGFLLVLYTDLSSGRPSRPHIYCNLMGCNQIKTFWSIGHEWLLSNELANAPQRNKLPSEVCINLWNIFSIQEYHESHCVLNQNIDFMTSNSILQRLSLWRTSRSLKDHVIDMSRLKKSIFFWMGMNISGLCCDLFQSTQKVVWSKWGLRPKRTSDSLTPRSFGR